MSDTPPNQSGPVYSINVRLINPTTGVFTTPIEMQVDPGASRSTISEDMLASLGLADVPIVGKESATLADGRTQEFPIVGLNIKVQVGQISPIIENLEMAVSPAGATPLLGTDVTQYFHTYMSGDALQMRPNWKALQRLDVAQGENTFSLQSKSEINKPIEPIKPIKPIEPVKPLEPLKPIKPLKA